MLKNSMRYLTKHFSSLKKKRKKTLVGGGEKWFSHLSKREMKPPQMSQNLPSCQEGYRGDCPICAAPGRDWPAIGVNPRQHVERAGCPRHLCPLPRLYACQEKLLEKSRKEKAIASLDRCSQLASATKLPANFPHPTWGPGLSAEHIKAGAPLIAVDLDMCPSTLVFLTAWTKPASDTRKMLLPGLFRVLPVYSRPGAGAVSVSRFSLWGYFLP